MLLLQTDKYVYYTLHRPPIQTCTHHPYQDIQNTFKVSLHAIKLIHKKKIKRKKTMQFLLICIKNSEKKQKENISFQKTNYTSNIYFHCDQGTSKLLTVKKNSDINFSTL